MIDDKTMILPGENSNYSQDRGEYLELSQEMELFEKMRSMGMFKALKEAMESEVNPETIAEIRPRVWGEIKEDLKIITVAGLVSATAQVLTIPANCKLIRVESTGRVWVTAHGGKAVASAETVEQAANNFSIAVVGKGYPKTFTSPAPGTTIYINAYPDNSETSVTFYCGDSVSGVEI